MRLTRLLTVVMLVSFCAGQLLAQSQATRSTNSQDSISADQFRISPYPQLEFISQDSRETDAPARDAEQYADGPGANMPQSRMHNLQEGWQPPADVACYTIRSYVVVRDSPHSDATHLDGYSTCVPSARFRVYSAVEHGR